LDEIENEVKTKNVLGEYKQKQKGKQNKNINITLEN